MNIVVCVKQVPNTTEIRINKETGTLIRDGVESIMNPDDKVGLETALRIKDQYGAHVTVITMGPAQAGKMLREALAMGADKAILLNDRAFAGSDTLATSSAISAAIKELDFDLVITGRQAIDGDTAQVGPQTAEFLGIPNISYVQSLEIDTDEKTITAHRQFEYGYQVQKTAMPCLITAIDELAEPRYMTPGGIFNAFEQEIITWGVDDIDVDVTTLGLKGSPTRVAESFARATKAQGVTIHQNGAEAAQTIVKKLQDSFIL